MDIDAVADDLYGIPPAEFTRARDARVTQLRKEGDRQAADAVKQLRRPSVGAWMANLLVRARADEIDRLVALGAELREAQDRLDGNMMRRRTSEGRAMVRALVGDATRLAREGGERISPAASEELESTLEAALANPEAAVALHTGRLTSGLRYSGLGLAESASLPPSTTSSPPASSRAVRETASRSGRAVAERELEAARRELSRAQGRDREAQKALKSAEAKLHDVKARAADSARSAREAAKAVRAAEKKLATLQARRT